MDERFETGFVQKMDFSRCCVKEESKKILIDSFVEESKTAGVRCLMAFGCWVSILTFLMFPDWKAPYATGIIFALLAIAYKREKP